MGAVAPPALAAAGTLPKLSVDDATVTEGDAGTTDLIFTVHLTPAGGRATATWWLVEGSAVAGQDYVLASGKVTFTRGASTANVAVKIIGDTLHEGTETINLALGRPHGATILDGEGIGTILDNDPV
ncbi:MAG TPA: Calx-beta domain-containing protein [Candidatus Thermoplasmatota archaeon]|nr:Calx-beta domain-containing protein [Candidatus Thermoplasmatota archaeon]